MYAGHFAAGLAIKTAAPRAPMAALMALVFLPDLIWLGFSLVGLETVEPGRWFDGWSHSVASIVVQAAFVAGLSWRRGAGVAGPLGAAVISHLLLDLPMHPAALQWYPHAATGFGNFLHGWAAAPWLFEKTRGWWVEAAFVTCGSAVYLLGMRREKISREAVTASALLVLSLQIAFG